MEANRVMLLSRRHHQAAGFTLIELLVVVAIIGILAAIAYPSYTEHVRKTRRSSAQACLQQNAQFMERYYTTNLTYAGAPAAGGCDPSLNAYYTISRTAVGAKSFTLQAALAAGAADPKCGTMTLDQKGATTPTTTGCW